MKRGRKDMGFAVRVVADASHEYHLARSIYAQTGGYDKVWRFDNQRRLQTFEERKAGGQITVKKSYSWSVTPVTSQPFIWQMDRMLEPWKANTITRRSTQRSISTAM